ncbi:ExeA family protein [Methylocaldum szegediense]|uniref:General secretion pathway protein A n=1 Tax=Methylocaldum szegediense TaxID=73780 RepID=A0ABM9I4Q1_9GAMM|nr:ExeA family protein [Methylocaldum szegediense]CAI8890646.1 General secretion pathway protein A [Methylocaldum szegediense]
MYAPYFHLSEPPFSIAPNPRYLYPSLQHQEALAHLLYGIGVGGGFVVLTGEVGTGKTTLCRCLVDRLPEDVDLALIFNPRLSPRELLASICDELRIAYPENRANLKQLIDLLNRHLLEVHARGRRTVVLIDEAQNLSLEVLEQIRLLTNLETNQAKLLQIILVGQPELGVLLARPNLRQLSQRICARFHLRPLKLCETAAYIRYRLRVSGGEDSLFSRPAIFEIHRRSGGIPRLINLICDRALLGAYGLGKARVSYAIARKAARELLPKPVAHAERSSALTRFALLAVLAVGGAVYLGLTLHSDPAALLHPLQADEQPKSDLPPPSPPQAKPAPEPARTAEPSFWELITDPSLTRDKAFASLLSLWRIELTDETTDLCRFAETKALRCLAVNTDWFKLRSLDHPAVLEFTLPDGTNRYAVLTGIRDDKIELSFGDRRLAFEFADILPFWRGGATLLWKPPAGESKSLTVGNRGEAVRWLRQMLHAPAQDGDDDYFDTALKTRLIAFQMENGLAADGVAGPYTLIHLAKRANDHDVPRLTSGSR